MTGAHRWATALLLLADVLALASIWRSRAHSSRTKVLWTALVVLLPGLGALGWFVLGKGRGVRRV